MKLIWRASKKYTIKWVNGALDFIKGTRDAIILKYFKYKLSTCSQAKE